MKKTDKCESSPFFSIITPVYNEKEYLSKCIESVLGQSDDDFEFIIVDDGSNDGSDKICDDYAKEDNRIKVYHQKNAGPSVARNLALHKATGDYVLFVDCDDFIEPDLLKEIKISISPRETWGKGGHDQSPDIIMFNGFVCDSEKGKRVMFGGLNQKEYLSSKQALLKMFEPYRMTLWTKAYRKELLKGIEFQSSLWNGEDRLFNYETQLKSLSILYIPYKGYNYRINKHSLSATEHVSKHKLDVEKAMRIVYQKSISDVSDTDIQNYFFKTYLNIITGVLFRAFLNDISNYDKKDIEDCLDFLNKNKESYLKIKSCFVSEQCKIIDSLFMDLEYARQNVIKIYTAFIENLKEFVKTFDSVFIYGTGNFALEIASMLQKNNIFFTGFTASSETSSSLTIKENNYSIIQIDKISEMQRKSSGFIICANHTNSDAICKTLYSLGVNQKQILYANSLGIHV